ncbi:guanylate cyclase domain-containing protein, partial [Haematococcus lacustris]
MAAGSPGQPLCLDLVCAGTEATGSHSTRCSTTGSGAPPLPATSAQPPSIRGQLPYPTRADSHLRGTQYIVLEERPVELAASSELSLLSTATASIGLAAGLEPHVEQLQRHNPSISTLAAQPLEHSLPSVKRPRGNQPKTWSLGLTAAQAVASKTSNQGLGLLGLLGLSPSAANGRDLHMADRPDHRPSISLSTKELASMSRPDTPRLGQGSVGWQRLCDLYREVEVEEPAALTVLAGLRVRVGMHTGLTADEVLVQSRMGASSTTYGGAALVLAKAVQACAHGGQIALSAATFVKLPVEELRAAGISVVHMGKHLVELGEGKGDTALDLYCATLDTAAHAHRLWALGPLRTARQLQPGVLHAPYGMAATVFMSVVGLAQLKAWDASLAKECLALYQATAQRVLLHVAGRQLPAGYLVSTADEDGMVLAAFSSSLQCLHWALLTLTTCMDVDWPQALLESLFGEEMMAEQQGHSYQTAADSTALAGSSAALLGQAGCSTVTPSHSVRLLRGLRLKGRLLALPELLQPLLVRPLGCRELRGIPGQVALVQVSLAAHTSRGQLEAADRLGLMAPGLELSRASH